MADEEDAGESWQPLDDEEMASETDKLKLELMKLATPVEAATLVPGGQPAVIGPDGKISTVRTIGVNLDGKEMNLPTVSPEGKLLSQKEAIDLYQKTGKHLGKFNSEEEASAAAESLHNQEEQQIGDVPKTNRYTPDQLRELGLQGLRDVPQTEAQKFQQGIEMLKERFKTGDPNALERNQGIADLKKAMTKAGPVNMEPDVPDIGSQVDIDPEAKIRNLTLNPAPDARAPEDVRRLAWRASIANTESGSLKGNYGLRGAVLKNGDQALGKYQIMRSNLDSWGRQVFGRPISEQEFLSNPDIQDKMFDARFGKYVEKYGEEGAARAWFAGERGMKNLGASDVHGRLSVKDYGQGFLRDLSKAVAYVNGRPQVPSARLTDRDLPSSYLSNAPMATTPPTLQGGMPDTPAAQALIANLMQGTPIGERLGTLNAAQKAMEFAKNNPKLRTQAIPKVPTTRQQTQVPGELPPPPGVIQTKTLPIPGVPTQDELNTRMIMTNPSVMSTAGAYMGMQPPPPKPFIERTMDLMSRLEKQHGMSAEPSLTSPSDWIAAGKTLRDTILRGGQKVEEAANAVAARHGLPNMYDSDNWTPENFGKLASASNDILKAATQADSAFAAGATAGLVQQGAGWLMGKPTVALAAAHGVTKSDSLLTATDWLLDKMQKTNEFSQTMIPPSQRGTTMANAGEIAGRIANPVPWMMGANTLGEVAGPSIMEWAKTLPEIPDLNPVTSAYGTDLTRTGQVTVGPDGKTLIGKTAAGPVVVEHSTIKALGWMGLATLGFAGTTKAMGVAVSKLPSPARVIDGTGGAGVAMSRMSDLLKANTLSTTQPLIDIYKRWEGSWNANQKAGLNPYAGQAVADVLHIYTGSGQRNFISSALENGDARTPNLSFRVQRSVKELNEFSKANPDFEEYLRLHIKRDELVRNQSINNKLNAVNSGAGSKLPQKPTVMYDITDRPYTVNQINRRIQDFEQSNPELKQGYQVYRDNITAGQRFVSAGGYRAEDPKALWASVQNVRNTPIFSTAHNPSKIFEQVRQGVSPLHILERELDGAITNRLNTEARRAYIDAHGPAPEAFIPLKSFGNNRTVSEDAILKVRRNGETISYVTDPVVATLLRFDPAGYQGIGSSFFRSSKQLFQAATTNVLAPYFVTTGSFRSWMQHFVTAPAWSQKVVNPLAPLMEIPRQLTPQLIQAWKPQIQALNQWAQGNGLGQLFGNQIDIVSRALLSHAANNFSKHLEVHGSHNRNWLDAATERRAYINKHQAANYHPGVNALLGYMSNMTQPFSNMWAGSKPVADAVGSSMKAIARAYKETGRVWVDSPNMAWARKNRNTIDPVTGLPIHPSKLAAEMRRLTGDPSERGSGAYNFGGGRVGKLPFESHNVLSTTVAKGVNTLGGIADFYHAAVPWSGVLVRSPVATVAAYKEDPMRFVAWFTATELMPELMAYIWNHQMGPEYVNHMMENRSPYNLTNSTYVAIPGRPPEHGLEIPNYQEAAFGRHAARIVLDQAFGRTPNTFQHEAWEMFKTLAKSNIEPPLPSPIGMMMGYFGATTPEGLSGEAFKPKDKGFRELHKQENTFERMVRAALPAVGDFWGQMSTAYGVNEGNVVQKTGAALRAGGRRMVERTALVRDVFGVFPPVSQSTVITEDLFKRKDAINNLVKFKKRDYESGGDIPSKGKSRGGMDLVRKFAPDLAHPNVDTIPNPGAAQPPPKNPIFTMALKEIEAAYQKDSPESGGRGFGSLLSTYGIYTQELDRMANVVAENAGPWFEKQKKNAVMNKVLDKNGVDRTDFRAVRDFYATQRNKTAKEILLYMMAAEQKIDQLPAIRKALGPDKHFTLDMADPYKPGLVNTKESE